MYKDETADPVPKAKALFAKFYRYFYTKELHNEDMVL
jgi:hypothetical protein